MRKKRQVNTIYFVKHIQNGIQDDVMCDAK